MWHHTNNSFLFAHVCSLDTKLRIMPLVRYLNVWVQQWRNYSPERMNTQQDSNVTDCHTCPPSKDVRMKVDNCSQVSNYSRMENKSHPWLALFECLNQKYNWTKRYRAMCYRSLNWHKSISFAPEHSCSKLLCAAAEYIVTTLSEIKFIYWCCKAILHCHKGGH